MVGRARHPTGERYSPTPGDRASLPAVAATEDDNQSTLREDLAFVLANQRSSNTNEKLQQLPPPEYLVPVDNNSQNILNIFNSSKLPTEKKTVLESLQQTQPNLHKSHPLQPHVSMSHPHQTYLLKSYSPLSVSPLSHMSTSSSEIELLVTIESEQQYEDVNNNRYDTKPGEPSTVSETNSNHEIFLRLPHP